MIKKISDLKIAESFVQINYVKGYKYIDRAGEIVNEFHIGNKEPLFTMDLNGLVINSPEQDIAEVKVSSQMYWAHFLEPASLDLIVETYMPKCEKINEILEIKKIKRIGWRLYFVKEFNKESERDGALKKMNIDTDIVFESGLFLLKNKDYNAKIRVRKAIKNDDNKTHAIIFDIDFSKLFTDDNLVQPSEIRATLLNFKQEARSEFWLQTINKIINRNE